MPAQAGAEAEESPAAVTSDSQMGRYRLCYELASGGMATVFLARIDGPQGFDKICAVKRIHPHLARENNFVQMFLDEARIASRINHPNVCGVFDFGDSPAPYIAMEFLSGEPLSRVLRAVWSQPWQKDSQMLPYFAARIIADACEGLHAAHELRDSDGQLLNVVHRDISPHNLFISYQGSVKVVDFGIASARNRVHHTATGEVKGKFAYMAPEQLRGKPVDRRADIWALGVVLWEMIAMKRLFRRETEMETIFAVASDRIPNPSEIRPQVPKELEAAIMKALTRDPEQRYENARQFGRDLLQFIATKGKLVGPADLAEWMTELFPDGEANKTQLVEAARHERSSHPMPIPEADDSPSQSNVLSVVDSQLLQRVSQAEAAEQKAVVKRAMAAATSKKTLTWLIAAALIASGLGIYFAVGGNVQVNEESHATSEPTQAHDTGQAPKEVIQQVQNKPAAQKQEPVQAPQDVAAVAVKSPSTEAAKTETKTDTPVKTDTSAKTATNDTATQAAAAGTGVVNIVTPGGWSYVLENGKRLGQTPMRLELPAGKHDLEIRPFGEPPAKRISVDLKPGQVERVSVRIGD